MAILDPAAGKPLVFSCPFPDGRTGLAIAELPAEPFHGAGSMMKACVNDVANRSNPRGFTQTQSRLMEPSLNLTGGIVPVLEVARFLCEIM